MQRKKLLKRFKLYLSQLSKRDRIALLYHTDADGLCSAVIAAKAIEKIRGRKPQLIFHQSHSQTSITNKTLAMLRKKKINKLIAVDLCVDQNPKNLIRASKFADVLVLDHHKIYKDLNSKNVVFIKAQRISNKEPSRYPASKLNYDLFSKIVDVRELDWVAAVGIIGDVALKSWNRFIKQTARRNKIGVEVLFGLRDLIGGVEAINLNKLNQLFKEFYSAKSPKKLLKSKLNKYRELAELEVLKHLIGMPFRAEFYPEKELIFYKIKTKYSIKSELINTMSKDFFPKQTVVIVADDGGKLLKVSARRQDFKVRVNSLLEKSLKGLKNASGGGHIPAAAGHLMKRDLEKFKKRLLKNL